MAKKRASPASRKKKDEDLPLVGVDMSKHADPFGYEDEGGDDDENTVTISLDPATAASIDNLLLRHDARMRLVRLRDRLREEGLTDHAEELDSIISALCEQSSEATDGDSSGRETG